MERVLILGCGGAGKSTLARRLGQLTGLPIIHLDAHFFSAGWVATPVEQWRTIVQELVAGERWIIDGNFASTLDLRLPRADTVVFIDLPRRVCLWRVLKRWITHRGRTRPDMAAGCNEQADLEFLKWIWSFRSRERPKTLQMIDRASAKGKQVHHLTSRAQVERFVSSLTSPVVVRGGAH